jgi:hypothetical protein
MNIYKPYTYVIGWSSIKKYYYGVRYAKNCNPSDLWVSYFTSSKQVAYYRKQFGEPDIIEIRKTFIDIDTARLWEHKVLKKLKVIDNEKWLNQTNNISFSHDVSVSASKKAATMKKGVPHTDIHKQRISEALSGKKRDPNIALKTKMTKELKRKEDPNYTGGPPKGRVFSEEHKKKLREAKLKHKG